MKFECDINFIGTFLLPFIGTIISIIFFLKQKTKKRIAYEIVSIEAIPEYDNPISKIKNPDKEIVIKYTNTGNTALETCDFHFPIKTNFIDSSILNCNIQRVLSDDGVEINLTQSNNSCSFRPDLMNEGDSISIKYTIHDFKNKIHLETKIKNGKRIYNMAIYDLFFQRLWLLASLYFGLYIHNSIKTKEIGLGPDLMWFFILTIPFTSLSILHLIRKIRAQYVIYFVWEINR